MAQTFSQPHTSPTLTLETPGTVRVTENQRKVIQDKYLKNAPSIESWLSGVARNIALAELLYHPSAYMWGLFDGVKLSKRENPSRIWLFHGGLTSATERDNNFQRFLNNCRKAYENHKEAQQAVSQWENQFFDVLSSWSFLPNSPTLMNAGRDSQQLSACYVLPIEDSMEGVTGALQAQALIHKSGGGTGFSFGRMRPAGDSVQSTEGVASGVISFMQVFDKLTAVVKQGGNRRGANMGVLPYNHPEIREFIRLKQRPGVMENFNISVGVDDKFFEAVQNNWEYDLVNPRTNQITGQVSARDIFDLICESAWKSGDPGLVFLDKINNSASNPTPQLGQIESTNPCGEQPLLPNEPCNLGSINLSECVTGEITKGEINWNKLKNLVFVAIRFLDNVIDVNNYPLPEMELLAKTNRRIGLGVMGWAETLVKLGIAYDSEEAITKAKEVMRFINTQAMSASEELAKERGTFSNWKGSIYDTANPIKPRHCARTTIAPTGTIGIAAGLQGAGIEPFFAMAYTRFNARALDAVKQNAAPNLEDIYFEVNPLFRLISEKNRFFGLSEKELWQKIEKNNKSIRGIAEIPESIQNLFPIAHDVSSDWHVKMQAAFQTHVDNAVSKTVNMPNTATIQDVRHAYQLAYDLNCKGITIYRDGSKQQQVLNLVSNTKPQKSKRDLSQGVSSEYYEIKTGHGPLHVHIDFDETGPYRVFASLAPVGTELSGLASLTGVMISKYLEEGGNPADLLKHLQSVKGDRPLGLGKNKINSIPHAIGVALRTHLQKHGWVATASDDQAELISEHDLETSKIAEDQALELWNLANTSDQCPECFSSNIRFGAGCSGPVCHDCGYSECN